MLLFLLLFSTAFDALSAKMIAALVVVAAVAAGAADGSKLIDDLLHATRFTQGRTGRGSQAR